MFNDYLVVKETTADTRGVWRLQGTYACDSGCLTAVWWWPQNVAAEGCHILNTLPINAQQVKTFCGRLWNRLYFSTEHQEWHMVSMCVQQLILKE